MEILNLLIREENLEFVPNKFSSSCKSLKKEVSDRLAIAIAKKSNIQMNSKESNDLLFFANKSPHNFNSIFPSSIKVSPDETYFKHTKEIQAYIPSFHPDHQKKNPKQVYLRVSPEIYDEKPETGSLPEMNNHIGIVNAGSFDDLYKDQVSPIQTYELGTREYEVNEKKKSMRQPTFGASNSHAFQSLSTIISPSNQMNHINATKFDGETDSKIYKERENKDLPPTTNPMKEKWSTESLLNSVKLRQDKFGNRTNSSQFTETQISSKTQKVKLNEGESIFGWTDIDVYLRNAIWLSAKNHKVALQKTYKEENEMKECTFNPKIDDKTTRLSFVSPKKLSEKTKDEKNSDFRKTLLSYRDIHGKRFEHNIDIKPLSELENVNN